MNGQRGGQLEGQVGGQTDGPTSGQIGGQPLIAIGFPFIAAAFAGTLFYAAPVAAARLITRTEITPARSS